MTRGRFSRKVQVVARASELGNLPDRIARLSTAVLRDQTFPPLIADHPWMVDQLAWPVMQEVGP